MGIAGAALATGIGQILTLTIYLFVYNTTEISVRARRDCMTPNRKMDVSLYAIGIPAILNLAPLAAGVVPQLHSGGLFAGLRGGAGHLL